MSLLPSVNYTTLFWRMRIWIVPNWVTGFSITYWHGSLCSASVSEIRSVITDTFFILHISPPSDLNLAVSLLQNQQAANGKCQYYILHCDNRPIFCFYTGEKKVACPDPCTVKLTVDSWGRFKIPQLCAFIKFCLT